MKLFPQYAQKTIAGAVLVCMLGARVPGPAFPRVTAGVSVARLKPGSSPSWAAISWAEDTGGGKGPRWEVGRNQDRESALMLFEDAGILIGLREDLGVSSARGLLVRGRERETQECPKNERKAKAETQGQGQQKN